MRSAAISPPTAISVNRTNLLKRPRRLVGGGASESPNAVAVGKELGGSGGGGSTTLTLTSTDTSSLRGTISGGGSTMLAVTSTDTSSSAWGRDSVEARSTTS